jgi:hypothetical protein
VRGFKRESHSVRRDRRKAGAAPRAVDHSGVERSTRAAPQDFEHVPDAPVGAGEGAAYFMGIKKDEVHAGW